MSCVRGVYFPPVTVLSPRHHVFIRYMKPFFRLRLTGVFRPQAPFGMLWWPVLISGLNVYLTLPPYRYVGDYATNRFLPLASSGVVCTGLGAYLVDGGTVCSRASACAFTTTERALANQARRLFTIIGSMLLPVASSSLPRCHTVPPRW